MMWHSDNTRTRELVDFFTEANINSLMTSIGMADSSINHVFGCGGPIPNQTTLNDLATLYRGVANGTLLVEAGDANGNKRAPLCCQVGRPRPA